MNQVFQQDLGEKEKNLTEEDLETKIIGVCWKPAQDVITFIIREESIRLLSLIGRIFDPIRTRCSTDCKSQNNAETAYQSSIRLRRRHPNGRKGLAVVVVEESAAAQ